MTVRALPDRTTWSPDKPAAEMAAALGGLEGGEAVPPEPPRPIGGDDGMGRAGDAVLVDAGAGHEDAADNLGTRDIAGAGRGARSSASRPAVQRDDGAVIGRKARALRRRCRTPQRDSRRRAPRPRRARHPAPCRRHRASASGSPPHRPARTAAPWHSLRRARATVSTPALLVEKRTSCMVGTLDEDQMPAASVAWPHSATSTAGVNQRRSKSAVSGSAQGTMKAVSARLFSCGDRQQHRIGQPCRSAA